MSKLSWAGRLAVSLAAGVWTALGQTRPPGEAALFEPLPVVEAASLHSQTLEDAPASVTVITAEQIRRYGYRTLAEALSSARCFYMSYDRIYHYAGVRGFNLPGDFNVRFLVMLNGHNLADNIYGSSGFFGQDFGLDMDLIQRIEIIRGPLSTLYGSNGIFATVNIVTKSPVEFPAARVSTEFGSFGEKKGLLSASLQLGGGANLIIAGSVFNNSGQSLYFPEYDTPQTNFGWARGADGERGYHAFANLVWGRWSFTALVNDREKQLPITWGETVFGDPAARVWDSRNFFESTYTRDVGAGKLRWRLYYDQYRWRGRYDYPLEGGLIEDNRDVGYGDWIGTQFTYRFEIPRFGALTAGTEVNADIRALQRNYDVAPEPVEYLNVDKPDLYYGLFAQHEIALSRRWNLVTGLRFDDSRNKPRFFSPRVALLYQHSPATVVKLLYGRSFRNPNDSELYYDDGGLTSLANPGLRPERAHSVEVAWERKLPRSLAATVTVFHSRLEELIQYVHGAGGLLQFQNMSGMRNTGAGFEISGRPLGRLEFDASLGLQKPIYSDTRAVLPNSAGRVAKLRSALWIWRDKLTVSGALHHLSSRPTLAGAELAPVWLADLTLATHQLHPQFDLVLGVRNLADRQYYDPVALVPRVDQMRADGRSVFIKLIWRAPEEPGTGKP